MKKEKKTVIKKLLPLLLLMTMLMTACSSGRGNEADTTDKTSEGPLVTAAASSEAAAADSGTAAESGEASATESATGTAAESGEASATSTAALTAAAGIEVSTADELKKALREAEPGSSILLHEGIYEGHFDCKVSGTEDAYICIKSCPGEKATLTIPKNSDGAALRFEECAYVQVEDLIFNDLQAEEAYGVLLNSGASYITVRNCEFSNIVTNAPGTTYEPAGGANAIILYCDTKDTIHHVTIEGNKVHDNVNGWSENISIAGNCEYVYVNNNEVYDCTNIGIDFYGNAEYCPFPELDQARHCECIGNRVYNCNSFYAENAGIYVDGSYDILIEDNECYNNFYGIEVGSEEWRDYYSDDKRVHDIIVRKNYMHDNSDCGLRVGGWSNDDSTGIVYNCRFENNRFENNRNEIILAKCDTIVFEGNSFTNGVLTENALVYDPGISKSKITNISCID